MFTHLLEDRKFASSISCLNFDEGHFIVTSGEPDKENKIFRIEYSKCFEIRLRLSVKTPCTVFSATMPQEIQDKILKSLKLPTDPSKTSFITLSTNRPNLCFAVRQITGALSNVSNLDFLTSRPYHPPLARFKKTLIFVQTKSLAGLVERHLLRSLPGIVRRIHSNMSDQYQEEAINDFIDPNGRTLVLVCTSLLSNVSYTIFLTKRYHYLIIF